MKSANIRRLSIFILKLFTITSVLLNFNILSASADYSILTKGLQSKNFNERLSAVEAIGHIGDEKAVDALIDLLNNKNEDWEIQARAIRLLGDIKDPRAVSILLEYLDNVFLNYECPAIKWNTAIALGNFKNNSKVFDALIHNLSYDNLQVREAVIQSLGAIGHKDAVHYLLPILKENSFALKYSALQALMSIADPQSILHLKKFVAYENDPILKKEAMKAIKETSAMLIPGI